MNPILLADSYKLDHRRQYPEGTTKVYSNWTPRASRVADQTEVVFLGLQYFLDRYLMDEFGHFFATDCDRVCDEYQRRLDTHLGPNDIGTDHIRALHDLGHLPLEFRAVPEGTRVPLRVPMLTVENTHPDFFWLTNYLETLLSNVLWLPCTSATTAWRMRDLLMRAAGATGSPAEFVGFQGHDFSFRGMSSPESAALSGLGHLLFFEGTDTIPAIDLAENYYGVTDPGHLIGASVAATEHSVMCAGGETGEFETFERLLDLYPAGIVSVVSDTWDLWNVLTDIMPKLRDRIMNRDGKLVLRPDSGDPVAIICGDPSFPADTPEHKGVVELLWEEFGGTTTDSGFKMLDPHVGVIYGDSITYERANAILTNLYRKGFASANMVFGVGSFTYQYTTRDTFGFAMKATWVEIDGEGRDIFKAPKTDSGLKNSAKGRLAVVRSDDGTLSLINQATPEQEAHSELQPVWRDGKFLRHESFDEIRERARS
jgi:nicotinamide phosphoribosyltransferase